MSNFKILHKRKTTGSIMVSAVLAVFVWIGIAQSMAMIVNSNFKSIKSGKTALQAQQYADISINRLKCIMYDDLDEEGAHERRLIEGVSGQWEDEITIGPESIVPGTDDAKQRIATINIYKPGDTLPRYTVEVPFTSQSNVLPYGTIVPYVGELEKIPHGWALCDGSNGTPDLRGQFLQGMTNQDKVKKYIAAGLPNITGEVGPIQYRIAQMQSEQGAMYIDLSGPFGSTLWENYIDSFYSNNGGEGFYRVSFDASKSNAIYGSSNTVQPPSYTVYYIMRIRAKH